MCVRQSLRVSTVRRFCPEWCGSFLTVVRRQQLFEVSYGFLISIILKKFKV